MKIIVTGCTSVIDSGVVRRIINDTSDRAINLDKLTYGGGLASVTQVESAYVY